MTSKMEGGNEEVAAAVTAIGNNVGTFVASKNAGDDARWPIFRTPDPMNRPHPVPWDTRHKRPSQLEPMKHRSSSDWTERSRDKGKLVFLRIAKFG